MQTLNLKPNHKAVRDYYAALGQTQQLSLLHEGAVASHFANLLRVCARQFGWSLEEQYNLPRKGQRPEAASGRPLQADGVLLDSFKLRHGVWETKDTHDDLPKEVKVFDYKLGNHSALDGVIDQYQVSTDKRRGISNDPNRADDETYIVRLIKQVISVILETTEIINNLPPLEIIDSDSTVGTSVTA